MMSQPKWKFVTNLGDKHPLDHGGLFVYIDETGVYPPEMERVEPNSDDDKDGWEVHRVVLDRCTYIDGILSDNKFHPTHAAWFAQPESERKERPQDTTYLQGVCDCMDYDMDELIADFCSDDPVRLAMAYRAIGDYHGWQNLDSYPLEFTSRSELKKRYRKELKAC